MSVEKAFHKTDATLLVAGMILTTAAVELAMGQPLISRSGQIFLWVGDVQSRECSQQLLDWYSLSHLLHGLMFYALIQLAIRRLGAVGLISPERFSVRSSILWVTGLESIWEILENTPMVIHRYREATLALGYAGDSVLNSISDIGCCLLGLWLARRFSVRMSVALFVSIELLLAWQIRDNLTLNILMLMWPVAAIRQWQLGH